MLFREKSLKEGSTPLVPILYTLVTCALLKLPNQF